MEAARNGGMTAVAVVAGSAVSEEALRQSGATFVVPDLDALSLDALSLAG